MKGLLLFLYFFVITVIDLLFGQNYFFGKFLVIEHFTCLVYLYMDIGFLGHVLSSWTAWFYSISPSEQNMSYNIYFSLEVQLIFRLSHGGYEESKS